jgi:hypothetical protein
MITCDAYNAYYTDSDAFDCAIFLQNYSWLGIHVFMNEYCMSPYRLYSHFYTRGPHVYWSLRDVTEREQRL